jgi:hypothetical protein
MESILAERFLVAVSLRGYEYARNGTSSTSSGPSSVADISGTPAVPG